MSLITLGINHETAPVEVREKVAFTPESLLEALTELKGWDKVKESVILSTCNRTELYLEIKDDEKECMVEWLAEFHGFSVADIKEKVYVYRGKSAVQHLMTVAAGLDSLILGEPQILGQLKQAYTSAKHVGTVSGGFDKLFQTTFNAAKKVRSETEIGENAVSVAFASVQLAKQIFSDVAKCKVLLIGAGETIELVARHLSEQGVSSMVVANRTLSRGEELAQKFSAETITLSQLHSRIAEADIVISSTASQLPLVGKGMVESAVKQRRYRPMLMVDLAVPRDVEEECNEVDGVFLYTVDDLQNIVSQNLASREKAADAARAMILDESAKWESWLHRQQHVNLIKQLRQKHEEEKNKLLQRAVNLITEGQEPQSVITELANKLTNVMSHAPTQALKSAAENKDTDLLAKLSEIYQLEYTKEEK